MKKKVAIITIVLLILVIGAGGWKFFDIYDHAKSHVPKNTTINGIDCSDLSIKKATVKLTDEWNKHSFIVKKGDKKIAEIKRIDYEYDIEKGLKKITDIGPYKTVKRYLFSKENAFKLAMGIKGDPASLTKAIKQMKFLDAKYKTKTKDAYVDLSTREFKIVKEVYGDNVDKNRFKDRIKKDIADGNFELEYQAKDYYALPKLKSGDKKIAERKQWCKDNLSQKITYEFRDGNVTLTPAQLNKVLKFDDDNKKSIKAKELENLVYSLAANHNTAYGSRSFKTHSGNTITVSGGDYGWIIDQKAERKRLKESLLKGDDETMKPKYSQEPYYTGKGSDIGDSYVEVDLGSQQLFLYKGGKQQLSCNVVSGKVTDGHATPGGTYQLDYKQRNTTLKGYNTDGTKYESPVSYWMPFNGGIGLHDASWRNAFGGSIYYRNGSHGCVNMPVWAAQTVFGQIDEGFPIVVYY